MLEIVKVKSINGMTLARDKVKSLRETAQSSSLTTSLQDVTQKSSMALQAKATALNLKVSAAAVKLSDSSLSLSDTVTESDIEEGKAFTDTSPEKEGLLVEELRQDCGLTKRQRLYGALSCYFFGALCGLLSTLMMWGGPKHVKQFAFFYTLGTLSSISSSLFLIGPMRQLKVMCMPIRRLACCVWLGAIMMTLLIAFGFPKATPLVLLLVMIQYAAMLWYVASFIPYGRTVLRKSCSKAVNYVSS